MTKKDEEKTAFHTEEGVFCYKKMPFGLKNAGATYQRLVDSAFKEQIGVNLEAYVNDMVIKSRTEQDIIKYIEQTFSPLRRINMKLNPKKCSFGIEEGKFLGYIVTSEGIKANPEKVKAVMDMPSPKTLKQMQSLSGKLAALNSTNDGGLGEAPTVRDGETKYLSLYVSCSLTRGKNNYVSMEKKKTSLAPSLPRSQSVKVKDIQAFVDFQGSSSQGEGFYEAKGKRMIKIPGKKGLGYVGDIQHEVLPGPVDEVVAKAMNLGYFWPSMHRDARELIRACDDCQAHASVPRLPKADMISVTSAWPFMKWGMDIVGPLPNGSGRVEYLIVASDYFTKWMEANPLVYLTAYLKLIIIIFNNYNLHK
ncbi:reverse transcriptase domain-containing protein [Tanacetum coccineum]